MHTYTCPTKILSCTTGERNLCPVAAAAAGERKRGNTCKQYSYKNKVLLTFYKQEEINFL